MPDRPIIFCAPMVRALLDGRKTQTRRVLKLPTKTHSGGPIYERKDMGGWAATTIGGHGCFTVDRDGNRIAAPERPAIWHQTTGTTMALPYAPGDRLYVREAHYLTDTGDYEIAICAEDSDAVREHFDLINVLAAQHGLPETWKAPHLKLRPSIHMPRWASRLTLTVTEVRVQRLQEITFGDTLAEGIEATDIHARRQRACLDGSGPCGSVCRDSLQELWNSLHGPDAWDANPWVVAVSFTVQRGNIDQIEVANA